MARWIRYLKYIVRQARSYIRASPVTIEYPYVTRRAPVLSHTRFRLDYIKCNGCLACAEVCPVGAISADWRTTPHISSESPPPSEEPHRYLSYLKVDYTRCIFCGLCTLACEPKALLFERKLLSPAFELSDLNEDLVRITTSMIAGKK